jgi:hypothetical protein
VVRVFFEAAPNVRSASEGESLRLKNAVPEVDSPVEDDDTGGRKKRDELDVREEKDGRRI